MPILFCRSTKIEPLDKGMMPLIQGIREKNLIH